VAVYNEINSQLRVVETVNHDERRARNCVWKKIDLGGAPLVRKAREKIVYAIIDEVALFIDDPNAELGLALGKLRIELTNESSGLAS
jgi:hypothetical protein